MGSVHVDSSRRDPARPVSRRLVVCGSLGTINRSNPWTRFADTTHISIQYMTKKNITTIEGLAEMIQRSMASKEDVNALDKKIQALDTKVAEGFERIEHLLMEEQKRKIENLETRMKKLEDALAI
jgi:hypothetical protein